MDILLYICWEYICVCICVCIYLLWVNFLNIYSFYEYLIVQFFENVSPFFSSNILSSPILFNLFSLSATCNTHVKHMLPPCRPQAHSLLFVCFTLANGWDLSPGPLPFLLHSCPDSCSAQPGKPSMRFLFLFAVWFPFGCLPYAYTCFTNCPLD